MIAPITRRSEFDALRIQGQRVRHGSLRLTYLSSVPGSSATDAHQLAFAINRKFGTAVERNRVRRRLQAVFRTLVSVDSEQKPPLGLYLFIPGRGLLSLSHEMIVDTVQGCLNRLRPES